MSAQPITTDDVVSAETSRARIGLLPAPVGSTVTTMGFVGIIVALIAVGMAAVMIVTTNVGAQSRELAGLRREATELSYTSAAMESNLQRMSSANALAMRASDLGMVPNPYPAFINLADGSVTGVPTPASGKEMPFLRGIAPVPVPAPVPAPEAPAPAPSAAAAQPEAETDLVAAAAAGGQQ